MKNKKLLLILAILTVSMLVLVACDKSTNTGTNEDNGQTDPASNEQGDNDRSNYLVVAELDDVQTLNPIINSASSAGIIIKHLNSGLTKEMEDGSFQNDMATNIEVSEDLLVYTITLRDDLVWSNGDKLTAEDFRYSWLKALDPEVASEYTFIIAPYIKNGAAYNKGDVTEDQVGIVVENDTTLKVTLEAPTPFFDQLLSFYTYRPIHKETYEANPDNYDRDPELSVTAGPYVLEEYKANDMIVLKKNENYWDADDITMPGIIFKVINDQTTAMNAYKAGEVHVNKNVGPEDQKELIASDSNFEVREQVGTYYYVFNNDKAPFDNVNVRKAFALAIDRNSIVKNVTGLGQLPATRFVPPSLLYSDGSNQNSKMTLLKETAQIEEAKKFLAEAGYPNGEGFPKVVFHYNTSEGHKAIAETIQQQLKSNLNIEIELQNQEWAVFQDTRTSGEFAIARHGWLGDYNDPTTMLELFTDESGNNDAQWRTKEYVYGKVNDTVPNPGAAKFNEYAVKYKAISAGPERDEAMKNAEYELIDEHMVVMPIYHYVTYSLVNSNLVEGHEYTLLNKDFYGHMEWID